MKSDSASVVDEVMALLDAGLDVHCLRDLTRGGLASCLNEIAGDAEVGVRLEDEAVPVREPVADVCELLGLDPAYVACEGRFIVVLPETQAERASRVLRESGASPAIIGSVVSNTNVAGGGVVVRHTALGGEHILDLLSGEQLPRIC